ncbi:MAG: hypothetical protein ACKO23_08805, partial [Gemmataceae bacterium]
MADNRLICPECNSSLRLSKPVPPGRKVKCPRCEALFSPGNPSPKTSPAKKDPPPSRKEGQSVQRPSGKKPASNKPSPEKKPKQEEEVYGYIKDQSEEQKETINYAPDLSVKDPRGPAIVTVTRPSTTLQFVGMLGALGWLVMFVILIIPTVFPLTPDAKELERIKMEKDRAERMGQKEKEKDGPKGPGFFNVYGYDAGEYFLVLMIPMILLFVYSCLVVGGGIKMQNLESRPWGIFSSVLCMLPFHVVGLGVVTFIVMQYALSMIMDDFDFITLVISVMIGIEYLICLAVGIWSLTTLMKED